ncbi:hypothetical protein DI272_17760 [Streptomyces sp. Act143]|nr:hypothetical protein DI272_17760 [Streptomyces sp. Act143]
MGMVAAAGVVTGTAGSASAATANNWCPSATYEFCVFKDANYQGEFYGVTSSNGCRTSAARTT